MEPTSAMTPSVASCEQPFCEQLLPRSETMPLTVPISLFERTSWHKPLMNLSKDMMLRIFTYHQVSPCYLNFIACFGSRTGASDLRFGGFRSHSFLRQPGPAVAGLNRSGVHYQLSIKLQSIKMDNNMGRVQAAGPQRAHKYRNPTAAIYHQFDMMKGTSLWILTSPLELSDEGLTNPLWNGIQDFLAIRRYPVASDTESDRFGASLGVLVYLAEWSVGDVAFYLHYLDENLTSIVSGRPCRMD
jgi:hypothetical protein